ncbi:CGNR zinc finger domain-containing protein [Streptomyces sp. NPDC002018]|uniref:CGNR zinc finger domain-containing protein n=1 Tax=Streptomyces sp. NPDC002018 TaxID=3364629 RepID=UPI003699CA51
MSWVASERYRVRQAPDGLALVQELLNTRGIKEYAPDLLAGHESAEEWLTGAAEAWARVRGLDVPDCSLSASDPATLRDLRSVFEELVAMAGDGTPAAGRAEPDARVRLAPDSRGQVRMIPSGRGAQWLEAALWSETLLAQRAGVWARLKLCRNSECRSAFYDTSRNNSGVWHDVRVCGNAANLRASRERRRARESDPATGPAAPAADPLAGPAPRTALGPGAGPAEG